MGVDSQHDPKYLVKKLVPVNQEEFELLCSKDIMRAYRVGARTYRLDDLPAGEPVFVLRGQDRDAEPMVYIYAGMEIARNDGKVTERAQHIIAHADEFKRWTPKKVPD